MNYSLEGLHKDSKDGFINHFNKEEKTMTNEQIINIYEDDSFVIRRTPVKTEDLTLEEGFMNFENHTMPIKDFNIFFADRWFLQDTSPMGLVYTYSNIVDLIQDILPLVVENSPIYPSRTEGITDFNQEHYFYINSGIPKLPVVNLEWCWEYCGYDKESRKEYCFYQACKQTHPFYNILGYFYDLEK